MSPSPHNPYGSDYQNMTANFGLKNFAVYSDRHEHVATVIDGLQNAAGELQYLVVEFIDWDPGKQLLIPVNLAQVDLPTQRLYVASLNRQQVLSTPAYHRNSAVNSGSAHAVQATVQPTELPMRSLEASAPLEVSAPLEGYGVSHAPIPPMQPERRVPPATHASTPAPIDQHPVVPTPHPNPAAPAVRSNVPPTRPPAEVTQEEVIPLREERLIVDRQKQKVGEVIVRKEIETEIIQVPVQREKLIVEQVGAEPRQLAEIDLTDEQDLPPGYRREAQLPPIPQREV
ncbi:MAG: DUF2382 domain-containing protein [Leptolyngbyaceae cyanobacterium bins.349]|nr:DUF2382 domain-containing protein [Leptolyngbyaceae cyanobacterium bins.349]